MTRLLAAVLLLWSAAGCAAQPQQRGWPEWQAFAEGFVDEQGRVIDWTAESRTVSEGQAYALFFALVANDRERFQRILQWTEKNLAKGNLDKNLPAWLWGRIDADRWGVKDPNSATDADLWLAYTLLEAGRIWNDAQYRALGRSLLEQVKQHAVMQVENGPLLLLPGREGFIDGDRIRLNPSYYVPVQLLRFQQEDPQGPWRRLLADYAAWLPQLAPLGRVPDWAQWQAGSVVQDKETSGVGSYDAIRVYLFNAFGPSGNDSAAALQDAVRPFGSMLDEIGRVPERWSNGNAGIEGQAPVGFYGALLPYHTMTQDDTGLARAKAALDKARNNKLYGHPAHYYDQVLILFGKGYADGKYRFDGNGGVVLTWKR